MRLDRYTANASGLSRRQVHRLIHSADVLVNNASAHSDLQLSATDRVTLYGDLLALPQDVYLVLHKPTGYICATEDGNHPTVLDLVGESPLARHPTEALQVVGRLDIDTTGLVLLTTDGQWNHRITSPNGKCHKTYEVVLAEPVANDQLALLEQGVLLRNETKPTRPCVIHRKSPNQVTVQLHEGKYHQVKRMFAAVGNRVTALHRVAIGGVTLTADLAEGQFRALTAAEVASFQ
jgi:16S rRNA pseudouridine516 synthase